MLLQNRIESAARIGDESKGRSVMRLSQQVLSLWAKSDKDGVGHPLLAHLLDTAAVTLELLRREPYATRRAYAADLAFDDEELALRWAAFFCALHDLGKATPVFQRVWEPGAKRVCQAGLKWDDRYYADPHSWVAHGVLSEVLVEEILGGFLHLESSVAKKIARALGAHHGFLASSPEVDKAEGTLCFEDSAWGNAREELVEALRYALEIDGRPLAAKGLSGPATLRIMALASFSDWIASDSSKFPYGRALGDLKAYFAQARDLARQALDRIGWRERHPLVKVPPSFKEAVGFDPNELQKKVAEALENAAGPILVLIEGPMGTGKTEAGFYAHLKLQLAAGHRGLYVALPTQATGNGLFPRLKNFLSRFPPPLAEQSCSPTLPIELQLQHGAALLNPEYLSLRPKEVWDDWGDKDPVSAQGRESRQHAVGAQEWFSARKRAMLAEYGVGTLDQALLGVLRVKHHFIRLWGLGNRTVILDEVHAYDTYTSGLMTGLIRWLGALGSSVILMSATLPPSRRRALLEAYGVEVRDLDFGPYPRIAVFHKDGKAVHHFATPRKSLKLKTAPVDVTHLADAINRSLPGCVGVIVNTVDRAQALYCQLGSGDFIRAKDLICRVPKLKEEIERNPHKGEIIVGKKIGGVEIFLLHARFPAEERAVREQVLLTLFGRSSNSNAARPEKAIIIATQVAEQSLDIDFDALYTDLAPIDLLLQRAGRLHRHERERPPHLAQPVLYVVGLDGCDNFGAPLHWNRVYEEYILLMTWYVLRDKQEIALPEEVEPLLCRVYESGPEALPEDLRMRAEEAWKNMEERRRREEEVARNLGLHNPEDLVGLPKGAQNLAADWQLDDDAEDERTQRLLTRLGDPTVTVIPLYRCGQELFLDREGKRPAPTRGGLSDNDVRALYERTVHLSRYPLPQVLLKEVAPSAWARHGVLRGVRKLEVGREFQLDRRKLRVELSEDMGVVYYVE